MALPSASESYGTKLDAQTVFKKIFDPTNNGILCVEVAGPSSDHGTTIGADRVIKESYDQTSNGLRVILVTP